MGFRPAALVDNSPGHGVSATHKNTKGRHEFSYGDFENVHGCGVLTAESRACQYKHFDIENAAAHLHGTIDAKHSEHGSARAGRHRQAHARRSKSAKLLSHQWVPPAAWVVRESPPQDRTRRLASMSDPASCQQNSFGALARGCIPTAQLTPIMDFGSHHCLNSGRAPPKDTRYSSADAGGADAAHRYPDTGGVPRAIDK
jgi:hypothetical protein